MRETTHKQISSHVSETDLNNFHTTEWHAVNTTEPQKY